MSVSFSPSPSSPTEEPSVPPSVPSSSGQSSPSVAKRRALPALRLVAGVAGGIILAVLVLRGAALAIVLAGLVAAALVGLAWLLVIIREQHWINRFWAWADAKQAKR